MGQTLTHGIYLPDEGERNCYSGLAANWQLLDGAVGTVAEHTAALAGKAPAVHTHTKADITDFPAYGNAAGTICEGNDSRLSDARTPVAHTHTKSDVIDLLNSNFIPSANNSYDLGSSSYQWNNLYAKRVNTQSLNGVNPGALSLPKVDGWNSGTEINAAVGIDITNWDITGGTWNEMTNNVQDGWIYFAFQNCGASDRAQVRYYGTNARYLTMSFNAYGSTGGGYYLYIAFPMAKGSTVNIAFVTSGTVMSKFIYPCIGNV